LLSGVQWMAENFASMPSNEKFAQMDMVRHVLICIQ
jgi:hypothetical protein